MKIITENRGWALAALHVMVDTAQWDSRVLHFGYFASVSNALATLGHNLAVAGALHRARAQGEETDGQP